MDEYDPDKKIGMIVDEWGTWFDVEPGTNPGFLYQQSTMRDALVAGLNLNIFNKHCDRVKMANIAQMVNVLQSVILTEGEKMVLTPTYHVFNMYKCHQDAELLDSYLETSEIGMGQWTVPNLQESVTLCKDGKIHVTINNLSVDESYPVEAIFTETAIKAVEGTILTGGMKDYNTFDDPEVVKTAAFAVDAVENNTVCFTMPPCSVVHLALEV
jgi:alpha-N-arabinofuranosidase